MEIWQNLKNGLGKTRHKFISQLGQLFSGGEIEEEFYEELEEVLISADLGVPAAEEVVARLRERVRQERLKEKEMVMEAIKDIMKDILLINARQEANKEDQGPVNGPKVLLILGVNGVGKTTSIAKLAYYHKSQGRKVLLAAGDTFRAAAVEQLERWANTMKIDVVKHQTGADPSAVIFDALQASLARGIDILLCDTAGRLHTKANLMEEMKKIHRVSERALAGAPHEVLLVLDATTGQNGLAQARQFHEAIPLSGIILAKLDGTARGGMAIAVCKELGIPIKYVGLGEKLEDLAVFEADKFVDAIFQ